MAIGGFFYGINLFLLVVNARIDFLFILVYAANPSILMVNNSIKSQMKG
jgi:hypothetical protein